MNVRQHLAAMHEKAAAHYVTAATQHRALAKCFGKAEGMESASDLADAHEGLAQSHIDMSEFHLKCCKDLSASMKAAGLGDGGNGNGLVPDRVGGIPTEFPNIRPVPRFGAPSLAASDVPEQFRDLVKTE